MNDNPASRTSRFILATGICTLFAVSGFAGTYQWNGTTDSTWGTASNWSPTGGVLTAGPAPTGGTVPHRLQVFNKNAAALVYDASLGTTTYANSATGLRGFVIGSGTNVWGSARITGGTLSSLGSAAEDVIGNTTPAGSVSSLTIDGGNYIGTNVGTIINFGQNNNATITVNSGTATMGPLTLGQVLGGSATLNLNGGVTTVSQIKRVVPSGTLTATSTVNFNGGTLKARTASAAFLAGISKANVMAPGAIIDTNGVDIVVSQPLLEDPASTGGGLAKNGAGKLSITGNNTFTGPVSVAEGTLSVSGSQATSGVTVATGAVLQYKASASSWALPALSVTDSTLSIDFGSYNAANPVPIALASLSAAGNTVVNLTGTGIPVGPVTLVTYSSNTGAGTFSMGTLPIGAAATISDTGSAIVATFTAPSVQQLTWSTGDGVWQVSGGANWNTGTATYLEYPSGVGDSVVFPAAASGTVSVPALVKPAATVIDTATASIFSGAGGIGGTGAVTKTGVGIATLNTVNSWTGGTTISAGALAAGVAGAIRGNVGVANNGTLGLTGGVTTGAGQTATITGPGVPTAGLVFSGSAVQRGAVMGITGDNTWAGDVSFSGTNTRIGVQDGASLTISGNIVQNVAGSVLSIRAGNTAGSNVTLSGTGNSWTGTTDIFSGGGSIRLGVTNAVPTGSVLRIGTTGIPGSTIFDLNGFSQTVAGLSIISGTASQITNAGAALSTLTLDGPTAQSFPGSIVDGSSTVALVKKGAFTQTLNSGVASTYTGTTTVQEGTLEVLTTLSNTPVQIDGGSVTGSGTLGGLVTVGAAGTLNPGTAAAKGKLTATGSVTLGGKLHFDVAAAATDSLSVAGTLTATGGTLEVAGTGLTELAYVLADYGTLTGTFATVTTPPGYEVVYGYGATSKQIALVKAQNGYSTWIAGYPSVTGDATLPGSDADGDSLPNLLEFVLGGEPNDVAPDARPTVALTPTDLVVTFSRRDIAESGIALVVQWSTGLDSWTTIPVGATSTGPVTVTENDAANDAISVAIPLGTEKHIFVRVKATQL